MTTEVATPEPTQIGTLEEADQQLAATPHIDTSRRNRIYQRQLEIIRQQQSGERVVVDGRQVSDASQSAGSFAPPQPLSDAEVNAVLMPLDDIPGDRAEIEALRYEWRGGLMAENLGYAKWLVDRYLPGNVDQIPDRIPVLRLAAQLARQVYADLAQARGSRQAAPASSTRDTSMTSEIAPSERAGSAREVWREIEELQTAIDKARSEGNHKAKNALYEQQLKAYARLPGGSRPIVGSGNRYA